MPLYIGQLKSLPSLPDDADCPLVTAEPLAELLPVERVVEGGEPVVLQNIRAQLEPPRPVMPAFGAGPSAAGAGALAPPPFKPMRARRNSEIRSYYVCTQTDCGWSGGSRQKHALNRSSCKATPCLLRYTRGQSLKSLVADFLARCTPHQREHGLPPEGAQPKRVQLEDGTEVLHVEVPPDKFPGDSFEIIASFGRRRQQSLNVTVPDGVSPGEMIALRPPEKQQRFPEQRRLQMEGQANPPNFIGAMRLAVNPDEDDPELDPRQFERLPPANLLE